jgi:hypothetical protein
MSSVLTHSARPVRVGVDGLGNAGEFDPPPRTTSSPNRRQRRYAVRVSAEPALPTFDTPKGTGLPFDHGRTDWARSRSSVVQANLRCPWHSGLTRVGGCRFGYVARHRLVHGFAQCGYLTEQPVEIIARNT